MIKIYHPIWVKDSGAYLSISKWNFDKERDDEVDLLVYNGNKIAGKAIISKKQWIKTAKQKEKKVVFRPDEPMEYYYNTVLFEKEQTEDEKMAEFSRQCL